MNCAVSGWLDFMKHIAESRIFSCIVSSAGLVVGVGLAEPVVVGVGIGLEIVGNVEVGVGESFGSDEGAGVGEAF